MTIELGGYEKINLLHQEEMIVTTTNGTKMGQNELLFSKTNGQMVIFKILFGCFLFVFVFFFFF
jgi:hypothetical protein